MSFILGMACLGLLSNLETANAQTESKTKAKSSASAAKVKANEAEKKAVSLDLNKATAEEMVEALPGVGEATAKKIVEGRPYKKVDDVLKAGVSLRILDGIRSLVVVTPLAEEKAKPKEKSAAKEKAKGKMAKAEPATKAKPPEPLSEKAKVNLNTGKLDELQSLPGIGEVTAKAIVAARPFKSIADLERVKGLGKAKIDALRPLVIVTAPASEDAPAVKTAAKENEKVKEAAPAKKELAKREAPSAAEPEKKAMEKPAKEKVAAKPASGTVKPGEMVNINTASKESLDQLPGIGPVKAQAILDARPFKTKEDIMKVKGIKEGEFGKIKDLITVE